MLIHCFIIILGGNSFYYGELIQAFYIHFLSFQVNKTFLPRFCNETHLVLMSARYSTINCADVHVQIMYNACNCSKYRAKWTQG